MTAGQVERRAAPRIEPPHLPCPCVHGALGRLLCALRRARPEPVELMSGALAALWSFFMLFQPGLFHLGVTYTVMSHLAPQWVWGTGALALASLRLGALLFGGPRMRRIASATMASAWCWLSIMIFLSAPGLIGGPAHFLFALACCWSYFQHGRGYT